MALDHVDVLIVGAGLSGIGAAVHLQQRVPGKTFAILEARDAIGGTWDLFRYPGIRSDSDMYTLGYSFRPWRHAKAIADGDTIREYVRDTAREHGVDRAIRFCHRVVRADWSTPEARWTVHAERTGTRETVLLTCSFLYVCSGYYRYDAGYTPPLPGLDSFDGQVVHPQHWPADLDSAGQRVVIIGSGATAVTLVPALAETAAHVLMLQRSPTYIASRPARDAIADSLRRRLPERAAYAAARWKNVLLATGLYQLSRRRPDVMKSLIRKGVVRQLPPGYDVDTHFSPRYDPWDQRLCLAPDGDFFAAIRSGRASVVTDRIATFTPTGIRLESGTELDADLVVTATGLVLLPLGGIELVVDGARVDPADTVAYKGMMLSGVPNLAMALGYTNASWTLKADLVAEYVCRLLQHMDARGHRQCVPVPPDPSETLRPLLDLTSGYVERALGSLPRQGPRAPWLLHQNYVRDVRLFRRAPLEDEAMRFSSPDRPALAVTQPAAV